MTATERYQIKLAKFRSRKTTGTKAGTFGHSKKVGSKENPLKTGVAGGIRTLGHWNHNPNQPRRKALKREKHRQLEDTQVAQDAPESATTGTVLGTVSYRYTPIVDAQFDSVYRLARRNARKRGIAFELQEEDFADLVRRSAGVCQLSGRRFEFSSKYDRNPYRPSIDRIDSRRGYTPDNCRLVCGALNVAMNVWGIDVLLELMDGVRAGQKGEQSGQGRANGRACPTCGTQEEK